MIIPAKIMIINAFFIVLLTLMSGVYGTEVPEVIQLSFLMKGVDTRPQLMKAAEIAANTVNNDESILPGSNIEFNLVDLSLALDNLKGMAESMAQYPSFAGYVGPYASGTAATIGTFCNVLNIPYISGTSTSPVLSNKAEEDGYPMFSRTSPGGLLYAEALIRIMKDAGWKRIGVFSSDTPYGLGLTSAVKEMMTKNKIQIIDHVTHPTLLENSKSSVEAAVNIALDKLKEAGASIIFYHGLEAALIMRLAMQKNMLGNQNSGVYQWLLGDSSCNSATFSEGNVFCDDECIAQLGNMRKAMRGTMCANAKMNADEDWIANWDTETGEGKLTEEEMAITGLTNWSGLNRYPYGIFYHDGVLTFAHAIHKVCQNDLLKYGSFSNCYKDLRSRGRDIIKAASEVEFEGASGKVYFDESQDRVFEMNMVSYHYDSEDTSNFGFMPYATHVAKTDTVEAIEGEVPMFANLGSSPPADMTKSELSKTFQTTLLVFVFPLLLIFSGFGISRVLKNKKEFRGKVFLSAPTLVSIITVLILWGLIRVIADLTVFNPGNLTSIGVLVDLISPILLCAILSFIFSRVWRFRAVTSNKRLVSISFSKFHQAHTLLILAAIPIGVAVLRLSPVMFGDITLNSELTLQDNADEEYFKISELLYDEILGKDSLILWSMAGLILYIAAVASFTTFMGYKSIDANLQKHKPVAAIELSSMIRLNGTIATLVLIRGITDIGFRFGFFDGAVVTHEGFDNETTGITGNSIRTLVIFRSICSILMWIVTIYYVLTHHWNVLFHKRVSLNTSSVAYSASSATNTTTKHGISQDLATKLNIMLGDTNSTTGLANSVGNYTTKKLPTIPLKCWNPIRIILLLGRLERERDF
eukprot:TRINITY_DN3138_c0_g2_i2.p1 TRINITY_DN3138_c0_g2~~TRINITY_DN3138_c0_g2_i2.p1  ORF type:complete len:868 (-),score=195.70 TRINITY_DN3138_c0_g2_i2:859-3462(-)